MKNNCVSCNISSKGIRCGKCRRNPTCIGCNSVVHTQQKIRCSQCNDKHISMKRMLRIKMVVVKCRHCKNIIIGRRKNARYCNKICRQDKINKQLFCYRKNGECNMCFKDLTESRGFKYCGIECYCYYRRLYIMNMRYPNKTLTLE